MANIDITLLENKRSRQAVDGLATIVATQAGGYSVIAGEVGATTFSVRYPSVYVGQSGHVYMRNAKGEYYIKQFGAIASVESFTLPASMTVEGNTILVFYATEGTGENLIKTVWAPVIVPVTATSVDYEKVAVASPDTLAETIAKADEALAKATAVENKANNGDFNGLSAWVRYSASPDGANMTTTWEPGQKYIGACVAKTAPTTPASYVWSLFVGSCQTAEDDTATAIEYTLVDNTDKTFKATGITSLKLIVPETVKHGFYCGVNIRTGDAECTVQTATNNSDYPLKYMERGYETTRFTKLAKNSVTIMSFFCDGINLYCYITEAET